MARIELKSIVKRWGPVFGVREVSIDIADREFLVLLGPSGCGKTTTMRMVAGLEHPSGGDIVIDGRRVNDLEPKDRDIAMVFQSYGLYAHLTVYENIRFPLRVRGVPASEHDARVRKAARMVELDALLDRKPKALSGGQRQRVALARAIVREPNAFLMDEPLSNLDAKLRVSTRAEIKHLQQTLGVTTIYVTHDQVEAMTLAHRVAVMEKGEVRQLGTPTDIYDDPADTFVASFIGSPAMNLIPGEAVDGHFRAPGVNARLPVGLTRANLVLGVRAEDLSVVPAESGLVQGELFSVEPLGDSTLVNMKPGGALVTARVAKEFRGDAGSTAGLGADPARLYLFDGATGKRLRLTGAGRI
jgi:multiple sugar transport system ATP-binding protein